VRLAPSFDFENLSSGEGGNMSPYWIEWWCRLFGYGSCRAMPALDAFVVWGGTALVVVALFLLFINAATNRL
jgi:hypothetical protein